MKTINSAAMAAIEAGEAIFVGGAEITPVLTTNVATPLVAIDDDWLYKTEPSGSAADYSALAYDDSAWSSGPGGFGNTGTSPFTPNADTVLFGGSSPIPDPGSSIWIRKHLGPLSANDLLVDVWHDDGGWLWFNGTAIALTDVTYFHSMGTVDSALINTGGDNVIVIKATDSVPAGGPTRIYAGGSIDQITAVTTAPTLRLWGGYWTIDIDGHPFQPIGARGLAQQAAGAIGAIAQGLQLILSGIDPTLDDIEDDSAAYKSASVAIYQLVFASDGVTLLDAFVDDRGRIDAISEEAIVGAALALIADVENAARSLGRSGARMRSDSDQRLISPTDGYFKHTAYAEEKSLYWGGKKPSRAGSVLGGGGASATGGTVGSSRVAV